jgi:hypothetical protein
MCRTQRRTPRGKSGSTDCGLLTSSLPLLAHTSMFAVSVQPPQVELPMSAGKVKLTQRKLGREVDTFRPENDDSSEGWPSGAQRLP